MAAGQAPGAVAVTVQRWRIPLARPDITSSDRAAVLEVLDSGLLSRGPAVRRFEASFRTVTGASEAVALSSGTAALALGVSALVPAPRRALTSPFTVPATVNALLAAGLEVRFVDIDDDTLALGPGTVDRQLRSEDLLVPVHAFGHPAAMGELATLAAERGAALVEDSCEALGTVIEDRAAGTIGQFGVFGFYPNKQITTGEGGMLVTADAGLADRVRRLRNHGRRMDGRWLDQDGIGTNARLSDLAAALGVAQLDRLAELLERRRAVAERYDALLTSAPLRVPASRPGYRDTALFAYVVVLDEASTAADRDALVDTLAAAGIQSGRYFAPLHCQPGLAGLGYRRGDFPVTEHVADRAVALPFHPGLGRDEIDEVAGRVRAFLG